ncbi:hypothetical protein ACFXKJ_27110 [Kitasatospora indigofera]|uniref:hypothetical protein n=1 Tax=Kitasatospora indigofera TaxID=67307 RepID=UPI0036B81F62
MTNETQVRAAAKRFRAALVQVKPTLDQNDHRLESLHAFPDGSCSEASGLLAVYLAHTGLGAWEVVSGGTPAGELGTHAWVEQDGLIVDITASQQGWPNKDVCICSGCSWHDQFGEETRVAAAVPAELADLYRRLESLADGL